MILSRNPYPSDVSDDEWAFVAPYLLLLPEDTGQRTYRLREVFNGWLWIARAGVPCRLMPNGLPPSSVVYQQTQCQFAAGCFAALVNDLRLLLRKAKGRNRQPERPSLIVASCNRRQKVAVVLATMEPDDAKAATSMCQSISSP